MLTTDTVVAFKKEGGRPPTPTEQARNILRIIGDFEREHGHALKRMTSEFYTQVGASNPDAAARLVLELARQGLLTARDASHVGGVSFLDASLTLDGWQKWEEQQRGRNISRRGVIAMKFGDVYFDQFVESVVKPAVAQIDGYSLHRVDDPENLKAGVIDNLMRQTIRDAAFVIADLSHSNNGAYWEAGYAEGLGKPVIYLCERAKWRVESTHFDTNHCTTLLWDMETHEAFSKQLVATLRNSLRIL